MSIFLWAALIKEALFLQTQRINQYLAALVQMDCEFLNVAGNTIKASQKIREAAAHGAKLVCLPEGFNTGYWGSHIPDMMALAEPLNGPTITAMQALATKMRLAFCAVISPSISRIHSFMRRRTLLRTTAFPTFLLTEKPLRIPPYLFLK